MDALAGPGADYITDGFSAKTPENEKPCPGMQAEILLSSSDVTGAIANKPGRFQAASGGTRCPAKEPGASRPVAYNRPGSRQGYVNLQAHSGNLASSLGLGPLCDVKRRVRAGREEELRHGRAPRDAALLGRKPMRHRTVRHKNDTRNERAVVGNDSEACP